jgi:hypothetical protein
MSKDFQHVEHFTDHIDAYVESETYILDLLRYFEDELIYETDKSVTPKPTAAPWLALAIEYFVQHVVSDDQIRDWLSESDN